MKGCYLCGRGFHDECKKCRKGKCHKKKVEPDFAVPKNQKPAGISEGSLKDPLSTGRKRAAKLYPIDTARPCEWKFMKQCGGGRYPVIGCFDGKQEHRHHGPIKDTLQNYVGNVHRICTPCHIHWHELNDPPYTEEDYRLLPHQPVPASELEVYQNALDWRTGKMGERHTLKSSLEGVAFRKALAND